MCALLLQCSLLMTVRSVNKAEMQAGVLGYFRAVKKKELKSVFHLIPVAAVMDKHLSRLLVLPESHLLAGGR